MYFEKKNAFFGKFRAHFKYKYTQICLHLCFSEPKERSPAATSTFTPIESPAEGAVVTTEVDGSQSTAQHEKVAFDTGSVMVKYTFDLFEIPQAKYKHKLRMNNINVIHYVF